MRWISRNLSLVFFLTAIFGCSTEKIEPTDINSDLFVNPENHAGQHVVIRGFLRYKFENRNLFPSKEHVNQRLCLPILIKNRDKQMIEGAEARDGTMVEIRGELVHAAPPGMVDVFSCKSVGLAVETIR